jgi:hypothetical protein
MAAAIALVLFEVMQAPTLFIVMHTPAKVLSMLIWEVFAGLGSHLPAGWPRAAKAVWNTRRHAAQSATQSLVSSFRAFLAARRHPSFTQSIEYCARLCQGHRRKR